MALKPAVVPLPLQPEIQEQGQKLAQPASRVEVERISPKVKAWVEIIGAGPAVWVGQVDNLAKPGFGPEFGFRPWSVQAWSQWLARVQPQPAAATPAASAPAGVPASTSAGKGALAAGRSQRSGLASRSLGQASPWPTRPQSGSTLALRQLRATVEWEDIEGLVVRTTTMEATAYTHTGNRTAAGVWPCQGVIAVDPRVIPLGTWLYVEGYGLGQALDTGGLIKGRRIDLFMDSERQAVVWGRQPVQVYILRSRPPGD